MPRTPLGRISSSQCTRAHNSTSLVLKTSTALPQTALLARRRPFSWQAWQAARAQDVLICQHTCTVLPSTGSASTSRSTNARAAGSACHAPGCRQQQQRSRLSTACLLTLCPHGQASSAAAKQVNAARAPGRSALAGCTVRLVVTTRARNFSGCGGRAGQACRQPWQGRARHRRQGARKGRQERAQGPEGRTGPQVIRVRALWHTLAPWHWWRAG